jgi:hypothetical protein
LPEWRERQAVAGKERFDNRLFHFGAVITSAG